ncbi:Zn-dependent alcohol dehydrogenase [Chthonomonas calidirosea]|uniref:Zn-dependent alcohol dehydrogenases n=2 Tax=Chthonomonas TaxID=1077265 RepID=S0EWT7_CHTCT|nr:Zn-dependent alcohol dehydrogenases [Chthonomonas calidirosea T49]CEK15405.1 Zn-dependent alcohol dehydrogenase [Chthonomonas calidirosea]
MDKLERYRRVLGTIPTKMLRWNLYGAGLENFGRSGAPEVEEIPQCGPHELLVRHDACGLCYSDTKVVSLGSQHPRLIGRDLTREPVTLGHEVCCTVVDVGSELEGHFERGERYVIQADVFHNGKSMAYGYVFRGGLSEYGIIPREMIEGDEGCYLLPIQAAIGYAEAALVEPWACVVASYAIAHRSHPKPGGSFLLVVGKDGENIEIGDVIGATLTSPVPREVVLITAEGLDVTPIIRQIEATNVKMTRRSVSDLMEGRIGNFDDIIIAGCWDAELVEKVCDMPADDGVVVLALTEPLPPKIALDIGRVHYNRRFYMGAKGNRVADAYKEPRTAELRAGGCAWFIGAAGPMGQMHVQRALQLPEPPELIVVTDRHDDRLESLNKRFGGLARQRQIELITRNVRGMDTDQQAEMLMELTRGRAFDDIVSMVADAAAIEAAVELLANGGWFNIFAGVARGTKIGVPCTRIVRDGCRFIGSSGSSLAAMRETLARVEQATLNTNASLAAIGGMEAARDGLQAVKEGRFPGKTLIFPHLHQLPLTALPDLKDVLPSVYGLLEDGQFWTRAAEEELFRLLL